MRIARLDLLRYGKFTDRSLALPQAARDFHLVVGPNEAGKSTLRNAILDLLFGIETRSRYNFLHAHGDMRLGALLEHDGKTLEFIRTKARLKTLQSPAGAVLPDTALTPFLGAADRAFFDQMFGLDHDRLVTGGEEILNASNDVGQILFQSAAGIGSLGAVREALESEADTLWARRRSGEREYYQASDELARAEAALKLATVRTKDWVAARAEVDRLEAEIEAARQQYRALEQARVRLDRVRRVAPLLTALREREQALAAMEASGAVILLPAEARGQLDRAELEIAKASQARALFDEQVKTLTARIGEIHPDPALLDRLADIEALSEQRQQLRNHASDIGKRQEEVRAHWQAIERLAHELGWPAAAEDILEKRIPSPLVRSAIAALIRRHELTVQSLTAAESLLADKQAEIRAIDSEFDALPRTEVSPQLTAALTAARALGDVGAQERELSAQLARARRERATATLQLAPWDAEIAALRRLQLPPQDEVSALQRRQTELETTAATLAERIAEQQSALNGLALEIAQYQTAHHPVSLADLSLARGRRDEVWRRIKSGALVLPLAAAEYATEYENQVADADQLSDRRHDKAQEASALQAKLDQQQRLRQQLDDLHLRQQEYTRAQAEFDAHWEARITAIGLAACRTLVVDSENRPQRAGFLPDSPPHGCSMGQEAGEKAAAAADLQPTIPKSDRLPDRMPLHRINAWRLVRDQVLHAAEAEAEAEQRLTLLRELASHAQTSLAQTLELQPENSVLSLSALVLRATETVDAANRAEARRAALAAQKTRADIALADAAHRFNQAQNALAEWCEKWQEQLASAHLAADSDTRVIEAALGLFERMDEHFRQMRALRTSRIDAMQRDLDDYANKARELAQAVAPALLDQPADLAADSIARDLGQRAAEASAAAQERLRLLGEKEQAEKALAGAISRLDAAQAELAPLMRLATATDNGALRGRIERSDQARGLQSGIDAALIALRETGDGLTRAALEAEFASADLARIGGELSALKAEVDEILERQSRLAGELNSAQKTLANIAGQDAAARAEAQRQEALARMANAAERYVKVYTAAKLLRWAIERYRETKQGPMLSRAGDIFSALTLGSFSRLALDYDNEPPTLFGQRASGEHVAIAGMSDGTRDQLYLALRLAALELHLRQAPALPFIADDLFINYDDTRSKAGLEALVNLSEMTQVILLTHHDHLIPVAESVFGAKLNVIRMDA